jgi:AmiR/NasT family two-component response regulator
MSDTYRISIVDNDPESLTTLRNYLILAGHTVFAEARSGEELIQICGSVHLDLIILDMNSITLDELSAVEKISEARVTPVIAIAEHFDNELIACAISSCIFAYLIKPIRLEELTAAIAVVSRQFAESQSLRDETSDLRQALEDRKIIERAKGIVMSRSGLDEVSAFHQLQQTARSTRQKLIDVARALLLVESAFE